MKDEIHIKKPERSGYVKKTDRIGVFGWLAVGLAGLVAIFKKGKDEK